VDRIFSLGTEGQRVGPLRRCKTSWFVVFWR